MQDAERFADADQGALGSATFTSFFRQLAADDEFDLSDILGHSDQQQLIGFDLFADAAAEASDSATNDNVLGEAATPDEAAAFRVDGSSISTGVPQQSTSKTSSAVDQAVALDAQAPDINVVVFAHAAATAAAASPASQLELVGSPELPPRPAAGIVAGLGRQPSSASTTAVAEFALQAPSILFGVATPAQAPSESLQRFVAPATPAAASQRAAASARSTSGARISRRSKAGGRAQQAAKAVPCREGSPAGCEAGGSPSTVAAVEGSASPVVTLSSNSAGNDGTMRAPQRTNSSSASPAQADTLLEPQGSGSRQQSPADTAADDACAVRAVAALVRHAQPQNMPAPSPFAAAAAVAGPGAAGVGPFLAAPRLQLPTAVPAAAYALDPAQKEAGPAAVPGMQSAPSASDLASAGLLSSRSSSSILRLPTLLPPALVHGSDSMLLHSAFSASAFDRTGLLRTARSMALHEASGRAGSAQMGTPAIPQDSAVALAQAAAHSCATEAQAFASAARASAPARAASAPADGAGLATGLFASAGQGVWAADGTGAHASSVPLAAPPFLRSNSATAAGQDFMQPLLVPRHSLNLHRGPAGPYAGAASASDAFGSSRKRRAAVASPAAVAGLASTDSVEGGTRSRRRTSMDGTAEAAQVGFVGPALMAQQITELTVLQAQLQSTLAGLHASWAAMQGPQQDMHSAGNADAGQRHEQLLQQVLDFAASGMGFMQQDRGV